MRLVLCLMGGALVAGAIVPRPVAAQSAIDSRVDRAVETEVPFNRRLIVSTRRLRSARSGCM